VVFRLVSGVLALTFLPIGVVVVIIGLTVATAATPDGTISTLIFVDPTKPPAEGSEVEIRYDPADPSTSSPCSSYDKRCDLSSTSAAAVGTQSPSRSSSVEDSSYQLSGARAPQNDRQRGSVVLQRIGGRSGSPVK
jgi:hypothetical protein